MQVCSESRWKLQGRFWRCYPSVSEPYKKLWLEGQGSQERTANAGESRWKLQGRFWRCYPSASKPYKKLRLGQEPVEAAGRVLEVLSGSFETLQKAPARPRASGSCREGFGGAIRQFRNPTKSCGWKAKGARSEQLMQVRSESRWKLQGRFWRCYPSVSEPYKKLWLEGQGSRPREPGASSKCQWKLQGGFWRCYPSASKPYKKLRLGQEPVKAAERVLEVLSVSFETLQKAPARPRASGSCREGFGGAIRQF